MYENGHFLTFFDVYPLSTVFLATLNSFSPCFKSDRSMASLCDDLRFNLTFALLEELIKQVLRI